MSSEHETWQRFPDGKVAVVFGSSRGIGGATAIALGQAGVNVLGTHMHPEFNKKQGQVEEKVRAGGARMQSVLADMSKKTGQDIFLEALSTVAPDGMDYAILNIAGGLEEDAPDGWPEKINIATQLRLLNLVLPNMRPGGSVFWITSLWSHKYGEVQQVIPSYEPQVALPKKITEELLKNRMGELAQRRIGLGIVSGHVMKDTGFYTIAKRKFPEILDILRPYAEGGDFASASTMGEVVVKMIRDGFDSGQVITAGGDEAPLYNDLEPAPFVLNRQQVSKTALPMYGDDKLLIDLFVGSRDRKKGQTRLDISRVATDGHFEDGYAGGIRLYRGVEQLEHQAQTLGAIYRFLDPSMVIVPGSGKMEVPMFRGAEVEWNGMVFSEDQMITDGQITGIGRNQITGVCETSIRGVGIVSKSKLTFDIAPLRTVQYMVKKQQSQRDKYWD